MCDLAHAALMEQFEGDARAERAGGFGDQPIADSRQSLEDALISEPVKVKTIPSDELALRRALGVA